MKPATYTRLTLAGLCVLVVLVSFAAWKLWSLSDGVNVKFSALDKGIQTIIELQEKMIMSITTVVQDTGGVSHTVTTTRESDEELSDYISRHTAHMNAAKAL